MPHFPGHLRAAFCEAVDDWPAAMADQEELFYNPWMAAWWSGLSAEQRGRYLVGQMFRCTDIMPGDLCSQLELPRGSTYAQGARSLWPTVADVTLPRRPAAARPKVHINEPWEFTGDWAAAEVGSPG